MTRRTQNAVVLMVTVHYSERMQIKISKGKRQMDEVQEKAGIRFLVCPPSGLGKSQQQCMTVLPTRKAHPQATQPANT